MGVQKYPAGEGNMQTMKGQLGLRSSALSPTSSKITTQYLVLDHMNNHYRKIVGAKSAIDNKPPKTLKSSQKIRDRKTRDYIKKTGSRPQSRMIASRPHSQMQYHTEDEDFGDENQWGEYDPDDEEERLVQTIMRTTLKPKSSSVNATHGSETEPTDRQYTYEDHANTQQRPFSANSKWMKTRTMMSAMKAITRPTSARADKTYDGDVLDKRSHVFTEEKPFTPRTLKTKNRTSRLSEYKYYTPPPQKRSTKKSEEETQVKNTTKKEAPTPKPRPRISSKSPQRVDASMTDTLMFESLQSRDFSRFEDKDELVPKLDISLDKDHMNWLQEQASKAQIRAKSGTLRSSMGRIREDEMMESTDFDQTRNMSTLGKTSTRNFGNTTLSTSHQLKKEEEELKYMEFMKDVTDDVLTRGVFTNRVLKQVFESHIRKKKGELDERKMRSMIGKVRGDLGILDDDSELGESGQLGETVSTSSFKLRPELSRFEQSKSSDVTFGSTVDSQNTYKFKSTSSADMFSTIHSENEDLSGTQALRDYQMNITRKEELSEGEVTPEESESLKVEKPRDEQPRVIQVSSKDEDNASVHSRISKARSSGNASVKSAGNMSARSTGNVSARSGDHVSVHSHASKAMSSGKASGPIASPKHRSQAGSQRDDDTLTERSQNRTDHTDDGEYEEDEFDTESDGEF